MNICINNIAEHYIFNYLKDNSNQIQQDKSYLLNLSTIHENELFIWNEKKLVIIVICIKYSYLNNNKNSSYKFYQELKLNNSPTFLIEHVLCNNSGNYIALFGKNGVCIVEKPLLIWSNNENQESLNSHFCKSYLVDEHFFSTNDSLTTLKWHPGSQYGQKFVFLTANNALRIYNIPNINQPVDVINLNSHSNSFLGISTHQVLGEICVSFDFGEVINVEELKSEGNQKTFKKMWPIYLLFENADIFEVLVEFNNTCKGMNIIRGPLLMYPPAEDNYGSDACCILYISSTPPIIVIATQEGKIYNCLLMQNVEDEEAFLTNKLLKMSAVPSLFVHERVDVELFFDNSDIYDVPMPIELYLDKICSNRYYVYCPTDIYSVLMPWLPKVKEFIFQDDPNQAEYIDLNENAIVKHQFCSKPLNSCDGEFLVGFANTFDHIIGCYSICLTNMFQCHILHNIYIKDLPLTIELKNDTFDSKSACDSLIKKISKLFENKSSIPILRGIDSEPSEDQFKFLCQITQVFREQYIQKFGIAHIELEKSVQRLLNVKKSQEEELKLLEDEMNKMLKLKNNVEKKLLLVVQTEKEQKARLEDAASQLYKSISIITNAEQIMKNNLDSWTIEISDLKKISQQLKTKNEKLNEKKYVQDLNSQSNKKTTFEDEHKLATVSVCIAREIEDISRLMNLTKRLKAILDL